MDPGPCGTDELPWRGYLTVSRDLVFQFRRVQLSRRALFSACGRSALALVSRVPSFRFPFGPTGKIWPKSGNVDRLPTALRVPRIRADKSGIPQFRGETLPHCQATHPEKHFHSLNPAQLRKALRCR